MERRSRRLFSGRLGRIIRSSTGGDNWLSSVEYEEPQVEDNSQSASEQFQQEKNVPEGANRISNIICWLGVLCFAWELLMWIAGEFVNTDDEYDEEFEEIKNILEEIIEILNEFMDPRRREFCRETMQLIESELLERNTDDEYEESFDEFQNNLEKIREILYEFMDPRRREFWRETMQLIESELLER
ncbi:uncharacterized protein [Palaemon carinicauda]|uniref:uncharacterized protein n=1 Tax=Palaemon carinicauda TaxID=392227 RepID=UPI0035B64C07